MVERMTTHDDQLGTVAEIMKDTDIAVLTYVSLEGALVSTPMGTQDFDEPSTHLVHHRAQHRQGARHRGRPAGQRVLLQQGRLGVPLRHRPRQPGPAKLEELWDASAGAFMSGGPEDPSNVLLEIDGATAEYWESPGKVSAAIQLAKGLVSDATPDLGDNDTVIL